MEDILETVEQPKNEVPQAVKTLAILTYVGNGLMVLIFLILFFWLMGTLNDAPRYVQFDMEEKGLMIAVFCVVILFCVLPIIGAYQMSKGKKWGFWMYLIPNVIWVILCFAAFANPDNEQGMSNLLIAGITIGFIAGFASNLKFLK